MKILLANCPWYDSVNNNWHGIRAGCRWPFIMNTPKPPADTAGFYNTYPFFMGYAASYLAYSAKVGEVYFYDALARAHTYEEFYKYIDNLKPDIVLLETSTPSIDNDLEISKNLKEKGIEVALAGPHASVFADSLIKLPFVDYVLPGEYEVSSYIMCLMRSKGIYKSRPKENINDLPWPARDNTSLLYADMFGQGQYIAQPQLQVWTSRGCPFKCSFCLWNHTMTCSYRKRSPKNVCKEISACMRSWKFNSVLLDDDTFNVGDEHTVTMSRALENLDIQWQALVRADSCSKEAFRVMRECGCMGLKIGVESFSQTGLDYVNKGYKSQELIDRLSYLIEVLGFKVFLSLMDNIPTETENDKSLTTQWRDYFVNKGATFQHPSCMALPGTKIYRDLNIKSENWKEYGVYYK